MKSGKDISRRNFLVGGISAGSMACGICSGSFISPPQAKAEEAISLPLPYANEYDEPVLDPDTVREYAFNHYFQGGCMHGAASGLMQAFKEAFEGRSTGWDLLPYGMYKYGSGGVAGWGTICGILNGTLAVLNLIGLHGKLGNEIMGWYSTTLFPTSNCEGFSVLKNGAVVTAIPDIEVLAYTVSDSPLCHISISKWCNAAGVSISDSSQEGMKYKDDRCSKICADTAAKAAELINEYVEEGVISSGYIVPNEFESCLNCHSEQKNQVGKMNCLGCHSPGDTLLISRRHPGRRRK